MYVWVERAHHELFHIVRQIVKVEPDAVTYVCMYVCIRNGKLEVLLCISSCMRNVCIKYCMYVVKVLLTEVVFDDLDRLSIGGKVVSQTEQEQVRVTSGRV